MPKYNVHYTLQGAMTVEANSKEEARDYVTGEISLKKDIASDDMLIKGIEGYYPNSNGDNTIDGDAIKILDIEVSEDGELL